MPLEGFAEHFLVTFPDLVGRRVLVALSATGKARPVSVTFEEGDGRLAEPAPFQKCLATKIAAVSFPAPQKGAVKLELPLWFAPAAM